MIGASVLGLEGASRLGDGGFYLAGIEHLAEEATPPTAPEAPPPPQDQGQGQDFFQEQEPPEEFIDPREIQDGLRNMKQFMAEAKRTIKQIKRQASPADIEEINQIIATVNQLYSTVSQSGVSEQAREAIRDFHDEQYWDKINKIRSRLEIPR